MAEPTDIPRAWSIEQALPIVPPVRQFPRVPLNDRWRYFGTVPGGECYIADAGTLPGAMDGKGAGQ